LIGDSAAAGQSAASSQSPIAELERNLRAVIA
jgi:hypothetical protein